MTLTDDQYLGLMKLEKWWRKYNTQFIEICGAIGTGTAELLKYFIENTNLNPDEVVYLSYDQKQVLSLAYKKYHAFYINSFLYKYIRIVDFDSIHVINSKSRELSYEYKKSLRKNIDSRYKLIIVFDSSLLNYQTLKDLSSFGVPVILIRDPFLIPAPDSHLFLSEPNIILRDLSDIYSKNPIVYIARKMLHKAYIPSGSYGEVTILSRKQLNLYNLKANDMILTLQESLADDINKTYREKVLNQKSSVNVVNERLIAMESLYKRKITDANNKKVKVFLTAGIVGFISRINKHAPNTKYVVIDFRPEFYHEAFEEIILDRHNLNNIDAPSHQLKPDEIGKFKYAYALNVSLARLSHWDKVLLILDKETEYDEELESRMIYTAITRASRNLIIAT